MLISGYEVSLLGLPHDEPIANGPSKLHASRPTVLLLLRTAEGIEGIGFTFLGAGLSRALKVAVEDMAAACIGLDPLQPELVRDRLVAMAGGAGPAGIFTLALAAIDIALWDIRGKAADQPLWRLLDGTNPFVQTYASGTMMRDFGLDTVLKACAKVTEAGYSQIKMQLALPGGFDRKREIERIRLVREALGDDIDIMCDVNQLWSVEQAVEMGEAIAEFGVEWLEDPVAHDDLAAQARVIAEQPVRIATGEYVYRLSGFRQLLETAAPHFVMIDPFRAGGITPWLEIAQLARAYDKPVVSHLAPEIQMHLIAAVPNGHTVEFMPWSVAMFREVPWPNKGRLHLGEAPGLGLEIDRKAVSRFKFC